MESVINSTEPIIYLGPFQGITDVFYRNLFRQYFGGIDKYYTPFFTGFVNFSVGKARVFEIDPALNDVLITVPQILSKDADEILHFAEQCKILGYREINWNLGCPYPRVANKKRGSGLLSHPDVIASIFGRLEGNLAIGLGVKCRLGYLSVDEFDTLLPVFNSFPLTELTVHARIGKQLYKGAVFESEFGKLIGRSNANLVYNGDVFSVKDYIHFNEAFHSLKYWMIGRGLLANPFLALEMKNRCMLKNDEKKEIVGKFMHELFQIRLKNANGNLSALGRMKELWSYLVWSFDSPLMAWRLIRKARNLEEYESAVNEVFSELGWKGYGFESDRSW
jgi:tRNA-dihydrouridine synthase B